MFGYLDPIVRDQGRSLNSNSQALLSNNGKENDRLDCYF